jgi:hypothetical protein
VEIGAKGRAWFGLTALAVVFGLVVQLIVTHNASEGAFFHSALSRTLNVFVFFTILSNIILGASCLLLWMDPDRSSPLFDTIRLTGVVGITITGVVYHAVLSGLFDLETWALVADNVLHTIVPVAAVIGWFVWGPRGRTSGRVVKLSLVFPVGWLVFTLIRGAIVDFYPYPFVDVNHLGYLKVLLNCLWVAVLYLGVASGAHVLDGWLTRLRSVLGASAHRADEIRDAGGSVLRR